MKTYIRHNCERNHRTIQTLAKCMFPRAEWISGTGPYACLAWCRVLTVTLHPTAGAAFASKRIIDDSACGGVCHRRHEVVYIGKCAA